MDNQTLVHNVTIDELENRLFNRLAEKLDELKTAYQQPPADKYLSRKETAKMLGVSLPTLDEIAKNGKIKFSRIGRIVRFLHSDVLACMNQLSNAKIVKA